jgi:hypothetical protein
MAYTKEQREAKLKQNATLESQDTVERSESPVIEKQKIKNLPLNTTVLVRSNRFGQLIYVCKKFNKRFDWDNIGSVQYMTLDELQALRNEARKFFEKTWIIIDGFADEEYADLYSTEEIYDFLTVSDYYKNYLCPENIDELFRMSASEIEKRLKTASSGSKEFIIIKANELIENRQLDSLSVIETLEDVLKCELSRPIRK